MAYIYPDSTIYLYNNIELDNSYKDTLYFSGIEEQNQYFNVTKPYKFAFLQQMYQRTNKGTLRIEKNAEALYDCNYLRFKNPRTINSTIYDKWYYAFITNWEYINENVTEITYEIDIMQTYFFDVIIEPSFVVRQMPLTDNDYENLVDEDLNIGKDYVVAQYVDSRKLTPDSIVVFSLKPFDGGDVPYGSIINGVPTPLAVKAFYQATLEATVDDYKDWLENHSSFTGPTQMAENIIAVYLVPNALTVNPYSGLIPDGAGDSVQTLSHNSHVGRDVIPTDFPVLSPILDFDGYTPHNYKLHNYPYNYVAVTNFQGDLVEYKYELFGNSATRNLAIAGVLLPTPAYMCYPKNYRGIPDDIDSGLSISEFPTMPVTIDGYQQWLLHNAGKMTAAGISLIASMGFAGAAYGMTPVMGTLAGGSSVASLGSMASSFTPGVMGQMSMMRAGQDMMHQLSGFTGNITNLIGTFVDAKKQANGSKGVPTGNGILMGLNKYGFQQYRMQIRRFEAEKLDTYFDMFGYKMNQVMSINRSSRPVYNYVKTEGCCIIQNQQGNTSSGATAKVISDLQKIYDNGITFWKPYSGFNIGDYSYACRDANSLHPQIVTP